MLMGETFFDKPLEQMKWATSPNSDKANERDAAEICRTFDVIERRAPGRMAFIAAMMKKATRDDIQNFIFEAAVRYLLKHAKPLSSWEKHNNIFPRFTPVPEKNGAHHQAYALAESTIHYHFYTDDVCTLLTPLENVTPADIKIIKELRGEKNLSKEGDKAMKAMIAKYSTNEIAVIKKEMSVLWKRTKQMSKMKPSPFVAGSKIAKMTHTQLLDTYKDDVAKAIVDATLDVNMISL